MSPEEFGSDEWSIVRALIEPPLAWSTLAEVERSSGLAADRFACALHRLDAAGYLAAWPEWPTAPAITFSPLGAERLDLRLIEVGSSEIPRWATADKPDPMRVRSRRPEWSYDLPVALRPLDHKPAVGGFPPCDAPPPTCSSTPPSTCSSSRPSPSRSSTRSYRSFRELIESYEYGTSTCMFSSIA